MDLTQHKIDKYADGVASLPDYPSDEGYTAEQLKAVFDSRSDNEIKEKHNGLIDELQGIVADLEDADGTAEQNAKDYADDLDRKLRGDIHETYATKAESKEYTDGEVNYLIESFKVGGFTAALANSAYYDNDEDIPIHQKYETKSGASSKLTEAKAYTDTLQSNLTGGSVKVKLAKNADYANTAFNADLAERDYYDNVIHETYATKAEAKTHTDALKQDLKDGRVIVKEANYAETANTAYNADLAERDYNDNIIHETYATKEETKAYADALETKLASEIESCEKSKNKGVPDGYAPLDSTGKIPNEFLYGQTVKEYGVRWKGTSSTVCERLGDAVGLVANAQLGVVSTVQNDFDNIYPWSEMRLCNLDAEGNILAYAGEPTFTRDGTNGDVMVQIPKFYYKRKKTAEGYEEWWICAVKLPGYELHPVFMDDGKEVSAVFHSAYNASNENLEDGTTILRSISGVQPATRTPRASFRIRARNKGLGWGIEDISCVHALQMLYMVEYASTNSQEKLGDGVSSLNYTATHLAVEAGENTNEFVTSTTNASKYKVGGRIEIGTSQGSNNKTSTPRTILSITVREDDADISVITFDGDPVASIAVGNMMWNVAPLNGSCDELNGGSGYIGTNGRADSAYRGIEGFHGKLFRFIDGVNIKDNLVHYANSTADHADGVYDGKYRAVGYTNATTNGYISEFGYDEKAPWVMFPTEVKGGQTTYASDYYSQNTGERLLLFGGGFTLGSSNDGVFYFSCGGDFSILYVSYGAHLLIKKPGDTTKQEVEELRNVIHETYVTKEEFNAAIATLQAIYTGGEGGGN